MRTRLLALALVSVTLLAGGSPARAGTVECHLQGSAGQFAVRKIVNPHYREVDFGIARSWPNQLRVSDDKNYHLFVGFWLLRASDFLGMSSAFFDHGTNLNPGGLAVSYQGMQPIDQPTPSSNLLVDGDQGRLGYASYLPAGTYYFIAFADGDGTFDISATFSDTAGGPTCDPVPGVTGRVVSYNALDFKGGTQVVGPGYGYVENARVSFTNPYPQSIGAFYCYQPQPLPPARCTVRADHITSQRNQSMDSIGGPYRDWTLDASYQGKSNTILFEMLQMSLTPTG